MIERTVFHCNVVGRIYKYVHKYHKPSWTPPHVSCGHFRVNSDWACVFIDIHCQDYGKLQCVVTGEQDSKLGSSKPSFCAVLPSIAISWSYHSLQFSLVQRFSLFKVLQAEKRDDSSTMNKPNHTSVHVLLLYYCKMSFVLFPTPNHRGFIPALGCPLFSVYSSWSDTFIVIYILIFCLFFCLLDLDQLAQVYKNPTSLFYNSPFNL